MKIIHFADTHIGVETYGSIDSTTGISTRVQDVLNALDGVIDYSINNDIDLVIFCGDVYKNREPSQTLQREFARRIRRLSEAVIPTVIIVGNHDLPGSSGRANSIEIFDTLKIENIHIAYRPAVMRIATKSGEIQIATMPWLRRSTLLTRADTKNLSIDLIKQQMQEIIAAKLNELSEAIDSTVPAILAGHLAVSTARIGTEKSMVIGNDPVVMLSTIVNPVYDYVALGHIHKRQVLNDNPPVIYSGSLERLDFGDEDEEKGFYEINIGDGTESRVTTYRFHQINARRFVSIGITVDDNMTDPFGYILLKVNEKKMAIADAVVRVRLSVPANMVKLLKENEILKVLKDAHHVSIGKEIRQESRTRGSGWITDNLTPLDALKNYVETRNYTSDYKQKLVDYGERLIKEKLIADRGENAG